MYPDSISQYLKLFPQGIKFFVNSGQLHWQSSAHTFHDNMDRSQNNATNVKSHRAAPTRRFSLSLNHHRSSSTAISNNFQSSEVDSLSPSDSMQIMSQRQTIGLRAKKYIIPRLLSNRKIALSALHPLSAALMSDVHYLLKVSDSVICQPLAFAEFVLPFTWLPKHIVLPPKASICTLELLYGSFRHQWCCNLVSILV